MTDSHISQLFLLQDGLEWSSPPVFMSSCNLILHLSRADTCSEFPIGKDESFLRLGHSGIAASTLFSWIAHSGRSQLSSSKDPQVALESSRGKELRFPPNRQHHFASHVSEHPSLGRGPSSLSQAFQGFSWHLTITSWGIPSQNHLSKLL